jgi:hypothetical protein
MSNTSEELLALKARVLAPFHQRHLPADASLLPDFLRPFAWDIGFLGLTDDGSRLALYRALPQSYKDDFVARFTTIFDRLAAWMRNEEQLKIPNLIAQQLMVVFMAYGGELG